MAVVTMGDPTPRLAPSDNRIFRVTLTGTYATADRIQIDPTLFHLNRVKRVRNCSVSVGDVIYKGIFRPNDIDALSYDSIYLIATSQTDNAAIVVPNGVDLTGLSMMLEIS